MTARGGLKGARIVFPTPTVGATHTALMAAVSATGESEIVNCAREPEIADTAAFLSAMGATIEGAGTHRMLVQGPASWRPASHTILPDRIEAASYLVAAGLTGGAWR